MSKLTRETVLTLKVITESDPESSRTWDNLATMMCDHGRYRLGDTYWNHVVGSATPPSAEAWEKYAEENKLLWLPLYLYDHSGITMKTIPFSCPWDSGRVGFIFVSRDSVIKEFGSFRKPAQAKAMKLMQLEVETYDQYLRGDVWQYIIEDQDGVVQDSWGCMYGEDYCRQEGEKMLAHMREELLKLPPSSCADTPADELREKMEYAGQALQDVHEFIRCHEFDGEDRERSAIFTKIEEAHLRVTGKEIHL